MPDAPADLAVDEALARRLIGGVCPELVVSSLEAAGEGFDNVLWRVNGRLVFRFPRREAARAGVEREIALLGRLGPLLPVPIPQPLYVGGAGHGYPWPFFGGPYLVGRESGEAELSDADRLALAEPLGVALRSLHSPSCAAALADAGLAVDPMGRADMQLRVRRAREALGDVQRTGMWSAGPFVIDLLNGARGLPAPTSVVVTHGDLHFRHVLIGDDGGLAGIIDWGDLCLASPAIDLQLLWSFLPPPARPVFARAYGPIGDENLLRARVLAFNLNAVLAIYGRRTGQPGIEREAVASLRRAASD